MFCNFEKADGGLFVKEKLEACGVNTSLCMFHEGKGFPTSYCIISQETFSRTVLHSRSSLYELKFDDFMKKIGSNFSMYSWLHFEGRSFPDICEIVQFVYTKRNSLLEGTGRPTTESPKSCIISVELERVKSKNELLTGVLPYADVAFVSKDFANSLGYETAKEAAMKIKIEHNLPKELIVIIPWGDQGADAIDANNVWYHCDAYAPVKVLDTIGAGDTFIAAVIFCLMNNPSLTDALKFGCELAGRKCGLFGFDKLI